MIPCPGTGLIIPYDSILMRIIKVAQDELSDRVMVESNQGM